MKRLCYCIWVCCVRFTFWLFEVFRCCVLKMLALEWVVLLIKYLIFKSRAMNIGVFKGHHRNDNHHIDLGTF